MGKSTSFYFNCVIYEIKTFIHIAQEVKKKNIIE